MDYFISLLMRPNIALVGAIASTSLLIAVIAVLAWRTYLKRNQIARRLRRLGCLFTRDLIIPDGIGGTIQTDYLVLMRGGLLVLDIKNYRGVLFGSENAPLWSQVVRSRSYKFTNPLPENSLRVQSLKHLLPDVPVLGRVVFMPEGQFPRDRPQGVSMLDTLFDDLGDFAGAAPLQHMGAWARLKAASGRVEPANTVAQTRA